MKKSTRILAILMAFVMLFGSFTVVGSAYSAYKGSEISDPSNFNDVDAPVYTTNQYASMALDELDRMLAEENMTAYVYIGTIDLRSVDNTLTSAVSLVEGLPTAVLSLLGDAVDLKDPILALKGYSRTMAKDSEGNDPDLQIIYGLLNLIGDLSPIVAKYADQSLDVGVLNGMISDYMFNISELLIGLLYAETNAGKAVKFDAMDDLDNLPEKYKTSGKTNAQINTAAMTILQDLLNEAILGEWKKLDDEFGDVKNADGTLIKQHSNVLYSYYDFDNKYGEEAPDTTNYDYYGWVHKKYWVTVGLGDCVRVKEGDDPPAPSYSALDLLGTKNGYEFIEDLMRQAYNGLLIPLLNRDTRPWLRKLCGVVYDETKTKKTIYNESTKEWDNNPSYDPTYDGEAYKVADLEKTNIYARLFNFEASAPYADFTTKYKDDTLVNNFNNILGEFITAILKNDIKVPDSELVTSWTWEKGGNSKLFSNICSVARSVLAVTGDLFFPAYFKTATATEIMEMNDQQVVAYVLRGILNGSVDWMYIDDSCQDIASVCYSAVEQLAWQDIPEQTYTAPVNTGDYDKYYKEVVEKCLDILLDVAIYNLNQDIDMVPDKTSTNPIDGDGLLTYQGDKGSYENTVLQVAAWAFDEYASVLALDLKCGKTGGSVKGLTIDDFWSDLDTILNQIIPIKTASGANARKPYICAEIASQPYVAKSFIFDYIVYPVLSLDASNFAKIFERNTAGAFAELNGVQIIVDLLEGIFDLLFPNVFKNGIYKSENPMGEILSNTLLGNMVGDLLQVLGTDSFTGKTNGSTIAGRGKEIATVALPVVCMLLDLNEDQSFKELESYLPSVISLSKDDSGNTINPSFLVYNGSSGVNTSYTDKNGDFTFDQLYTYIITGAYVDAIAEDGTVSSTVGISGITAGDDLPGGKSKNVTLSNVKAGQLLRVNIKYKVTLENGSYLGGENTELINTSYCYVAETGKEKDDDSIETTISAGNDRTIKYESEIYVKTGKSLASSVNGQSIRIADNKVNENVSKDDEASIVKVPATATAVTNGNASYPFAKLSTDADSIKAEMTGQGGTYFLNPFEIAVKGKNDKGEDIKYSRVEPVYQKNEKDEYVLDKDGNKIQTGWDDGVPVGKYTMTATVNVGGTEVKVPVNVHIYNDYGLESLVDRAISANRQRSDYKNGATIDQLWAAYQTALNNAAFLALKPKNGSNFETNIAVTGKTYANRYEQCAKLLENAIKALDTADNMNNAGVESIESALAKINGGNDFVRTSYIYNGNTYYYKDFIEYYEDGYPFFSMRDYVPHTFNAYRIARNRANNLINSQRFYTDAPLEAGYTDSEKASFDKSVEAYDKSEENRGAISSIESTYAIYMLNLTGNRLIRKVADTSKLEIVMDMCIGEKAGINVNGAAYYSQKSWTDYQNAVAFAQKVVTLSVGDAKDPGELRPSMVNEATSNLVESWKKLVEGCDYTRLDNAIKDTAEVLENAADPETNKADRVYTVESYATFYNAYAVAKKLNDARDLARTDENQAKIDKAIADLVAAQDALEWAPEGGDPVWSLLEDCEFVTFNNYQDPYSPWIDEAGSDGILDYNNSLYFADYDDFEATGLIFGIPEGADGFEGVESIVDVDNAENASFELVANASGNYSTGAILIVRNDEEEIVSIYMLVLRGDIEGDTEINAIDSEEYNVFVADGTEDWTMEDQYKYKYYAGDINGDFETDAADMGLLETVAQLEADVLQTPEGGVIDADGNLL